MTTIHKLVVSSLAFGLLAAGCSTSTQSTELVTPGSYLPGIPQLSGPVPEVRQAKVDTDSRVTTHRDSSPPVVSHAGVKRQ